MTQEPGGAQEQRGWSAGWLDASGRVRAARDLLRARYPGLTAQQLAAALQVNGGNYSQIERGRRQVTLPVFTRIAGGLLGTLELCYPQQPWTLHWFFPEHPLPSLPTWPLPPLAGLPELPPDALYRWNLDAVRVALARRLIRHRPLSLADLGELVAAATAANPRTMTTILEQIHAPRAGNRRTSGSVPTLLRLYGALQPLLATPARPLLLDDLLTIRRTRLDL